MNKNFGYCSISRMIRITFVLRMLLTTRKIYVILALSDRKERLVMKRNLITIVEEQGKSSERHLHINYEDKVFYIGTPAEDDVYMNWNENPAVNVLGYPEVDQQKQRLLGEGFRQVDKATYYNMSN